MCGIIAVKGEGSTTDVINGLKKLEYRGYDSCGICYKDNDKLCVVKKVGYVDNLVKSHVPSIDGVAIGHTRWATHGGVSEVNSHPHLSTSGKFAIVHNGIIENFAELKDKYLKGVYFASDTDSEVIAQMIEYYYRDNVWDAFKMAITSLRGSYAVVMVNSYDDNIYFARSGSPMIIGAGDDYYSISSDINGFNNIKSVCYVNDNNMGVIDNKVHLYDRNFNKLNINWCSLGDRCESVGKGEYSHYMLKEIYDIPNALRMCYDSIMGASIKLPSQIDRVLMVSCGTSYHSSLMGEKYIEGLVEIPTECEIASEYIYNSHVTRPNTLGIFISQSGETADTLSALKRAKEEGVYILAITNVRGSTITRLADEVLYLNAGAEICVASTKAYTSQVFSLLLVANIFQNIKHGEYDIKDGMIDVQPSRTKNYINVTSDELDKLYNVDISSLECEINNVAIELANKNELFLIGKNYDYITAREGSLKIKEVSYMFTDAYPCGELKHGTIALIEEGRVVIAVATEERLWDKVKNSVHEIVSRGGKVAGITQLSTNSSDFSHKITLPNLHPLLMPIVSIIPIDLIAYKVAVFKGNNPDKPRNLAKSVTVE